MDQAEIDLSVEFLYSTFQLFNTSEQDDVERAQSVLDALFNSHLYKMVENCAYIINCETYDSDLFVIAHAITAIRRAFDIRNFPSINVIRDRWASEPTEDCKQAVVNACVRAMMFPDENIYTNAASLFGSLFTVQVSELRPFEYISNLISGEYGETGIRAGLIAAREVCSPDYIDAEIRTYLNENMDPVFEQLGTLYSNITQFEIPTGQEILDLLKIIAESIPQYVQKPEVIEAIIQNAAELLPICQDVSLLERMFILLERLVEANYQLEYFKEIYDWTILSTLGMEALRNFTDPQYIMNTLMFFNFLLKFERDIMIYNTKIYYVNERAENSSKSTESVNYKLPKEKPFHSFYEVYSSDLIAKALELCANISDDDQEAEDLENPDVAMAACSIIRHLSFLNNEACNETVKFWEENKNSDSWNMRHALVIIPYLIINNQSKSYIRDKERQEMFPYVMRQLQTLGQIPRIIDSGLYSLEQIIKAFNFHISDECFNDIINILGALYGLNFTLNSDGSCEIQNGEAGLYNGETEVVIAKRVCNTMIALIKVMRSWKNRLVILYHPLYAIIREILKKFSNDDQIIMTAHFALCSYIRCAPTELHDIIMSDLLHLTIEQINTISNIIAEGGDTTAMRTMMIVKQWVLQSIFKNFNKNDAGSAAAVAEMLIENMQKQNMEPYHDDILQTLICVMGAMKSRASEIREQITSYVDFAFQTMNSKLVVDTLRSLTELIRNSPRDMEDGFREVIDHIMGLLVDEDFPNSDKPPLLGFVGDILEVEHNIVIGDPNLRNSIMDSIVGVYEQITSDLRLMSDPQFTNELYEGLYYAFSGILSATLPTDTDFLNRRTIRNFMKPIIPFMRQGEVTEAMVIAFTQFIDQAISVIGKKGNIQISYLCNFAVFYYGWAIGKMSWPDENTMLIRTCNEMIAKLEKV